MGRFLAVCREADIANLAVLLGFQNRLHRTTRAESLLDLLHVGQGVKLIQVEVVGLEQLERLLQFLRRTGGIPFKGLAGQETLVAVGLQRRAESSLGVAVEGGHVEVIHASIHGLGNEIGRLLGRHVLHDHAAEADDREFFLGASVPPLWNWPPRRLPASQFFLGGEIGGIESWQAAVVARELRRCMGHLPRQALYQSGQCFAEGRPGPVSFRCRRRLLTPSRDVFSPCGDESASGDASYNSHLPKLIGPASPRPPLPLWA